MAESKNGAGDVVLTNMRRKSQHKPLSMFEQSEEAYVFKMEGDVEGEVEAIVGSNAESVRELEVAESKGGTGEGTLNKATEWENPEESTSKTSMLQKLENIYWIRMQGRKLVILLQLVPT